MRTPTGEKAVSVKVNATTYRRLRRLAKLEQRAISTLIERAVIMYEREAAQ